MAEQADKTVVMNALDSLVRGNHLRAIAISGPWGVGKTHLIQEDFAKKAREDLREAGLKFVYVSLFGLTSLAAVRSRIAANSLSPWQRTLAHVPLIAQLGWVDMARAGDIARNLAEQALLKKLFVVIDDLERAESLEAGDVLGLISELIEQGGCKCVLVLNRAELAKKISQFEEKVFDLTLDYQPTIAEVVPYGLTREEDAKAAIPVFEAFGCGNIRIAKRLSWILLELGNTTYTQAFKIWPTIVRQATVLAIMKYKYGYDRGGLNLVIARTETSKFLKDVSKELGEKSEDELPAEVTDILDKIAYTDAGFGALIIDLLEKGSLDHEALASALADCAAAEMHVAQNARFRSFFQEMNAGFRIPSPEFAASIAAFLEEELVRPDRFDLFYLCDLLIQIDPSEKSIGLVARRLHDVVSPVKLEKREKNLGKLRHLMKAKVFDRIPHLESKKAYTLAECFNTASWEPEEVSPRIDAMSQFSEDAWVEFLLGLQADNAMQLIRRFRAHLKPQGGVPADALATLRTRFENALKKLAERDVLFQAKIADYADPDKKVGPF